MLFAVVDKNGMKSLHAAMEKPTLKETVHQKHCKRYFLFPQSAIMGFKCLPVFGFSWCQLSGLWDLVHQKITFVD